MNQHNANDFFHRAESFLLKLTLLILSSVGLAKVMYSETAPFLSEIFDHSEIRESQRNSPPLIFHQKLCRTRAERRYGRFVDTRKYIQYIYLYG